MLDLGTSFLASVERDPKALAIVDGDVRLTYGAWYDKISSLVAAFDDLGLTAGDHLITVLQNRWEAATVHWACQFAGVIVTPLNWRAKEDEIDFGIENAEGSAVVFQDVSAEAVANAKATQDLPRICIDFPAASAIDFARLVRAPRRSMRRRARTPTRGRSCFTPRARPRARKACRGVTGPSAPPLSHMWRRISIATANARWV
jgi:2-furoate---CoA ligase